jgi:hypothetical protein
LSPVGTKLFDFGIDAKDCSPHTNKNFFFFVFKNIERDLFIEILFCLRTLVCVTCPQLMHLHGQLSKLQPEIDKLLLIDRWVEFL